MKCRGPKSGLGRKSESDLPVKDKHRSRRANLRVYNDSNWVTLLVDVDEPASRIPLCCVDSAARQEVPCGWCYRLYGNCTVDFRALYGKKTVIELEWNSRSDSNDSVRHLICFDDRLYLSIFLWRMHISHDQRIYATVHTVVPTYAVSRKSNS